MDYIGEDDVEGQVCGWEDSDAVFVVAGFESTLDDEFSSELDFLAIEGVGSDVQLVVDGCDCSVCCRGDVSWDDLTEGHLVHAIDGLESLGLLEEMPFEQVLDLGHTFATSVLYRSVRRGRAFEIHDDAGESGLGHIGCDLNLAGDQRAGGYIRCIVHQDGRRFHVQSQLDRLRTRWGTWSIACMFVLGSSSFLGLGLFM